MLNGYAGTILRVGLSDEKVEKQPLPIKMTEAFIGGRGFVAKTLFDELPPNADPVGPDNLFIVASGPLSGQFMPASGKTHFGCKSPATGGYGDSNMGGHFGPALKYAGYDMLILTGRAKKPSLLVIEDDRIEIKPAGELWGMGSLSAETRLKEKMGEDYQILTIGPAGENLVAYACITHDFGRQAGRVGIGAVLGAKNIKAIECYEKGLLDRDAIGRDVKFGDLASVVHLLECIARRQGIGELLADGVKPAAQKIGQGSEAFAIHVKGLEWSGYECRNAPGMMLAYMTSDIGAHHARAWVLGHDLAGSSGSVHDLIISEGSSEKLPKSEVTGRAAKVIESQHLRPLFDLLGICRLQFMELGFEVDHYERLFKVVTGKTMTWDEMLSVSENAWQLTRSISAREIKGFGRSWDYPPERFMTEPVPDGPNQGHCINRQEVDILLDEYYAMRGWDQNGIPKAETLRRFGLMDVADSMPNWACHKGI